MAVFNWSSDISGAVNGVKTGNAVKSSQIGEIFDALQCVNNNFSSYRSSHGLSSFVSGSAYPNGNDTLSRHKPVTSNLLSKDDMNRVYEDFATIYSNVRCYSHFLSVNTAHYGGYYADQDYRHHH